LGANLTSDNRALERVQAEWEKLGRDDPLWAIVSAPGLRGKKWNVDDFFETGRERIGKIDARLAEHGLALGRGKALDFGCGVGRLTQALADRFEEVVGVDISETMVRSAEQFNKKGNRVNYVVNTRADLSVLAPKSFDLVLSDIALQHLPPRLALAYVSEFFRIVKPDGLVVFQLPRGPKNRWIAWIPEPILDPFVNEVRGLLRRLRPQSYPAWETHWIHPHRVQTAVAAAGGRILETIHEEGIAGSLDSRLYVGIRAA
jgi:SAM-dependent methyltransferase